MFSNKTRMKEEKPEMNKTPEVKHIPVLLNEVIENLNLKLGDTVFDGTVGGGGYLQRLCEVVGKKGLVVGIDQDEDALVRANKRIKKCSGCNCRLELVNENFRNIDSVLKDLNISEVQGVALDIGLSSFQFEESGRGFSFQKDEPLLMTFSKDPNKAIFTAREIVNSWDEENIADIIYGYGGEKFSRRIAKNIIEARKEKPIETTSELAKIVEDSIPAWLRGRSKIHAATKTFQALRIAVNDEIGALKEGLQKGFEALSKEGRMAVVSFHSSEDRIIKNFMKEKKDSGEGSLVFKKPLTPNDEEIKNNPRSRSAKLRVIIKK